MLREVLIINLMFCPLVILKRRHKDKEMSDKELGGNLVTALRNDANLDLSMDEEYEDLRAELLAYHTALASLTENSPTSDNSEDVAIAQLPSTDFSKTRRSMKSTPCWKMGGICIHHQLCQGHRYLTEVPACKDKKKVCCFSWNKSEVKDHKDKGISSMLFPWKGYKEIGGKGISNKDSDIENEAESPNGVVQIFEIIDKSDSTEESEEIEMITKKPKKHKNRPQQLRNNYNNYKEPILIVLKPSDPSN